MSSLFRQFAVLCLVSLWVSGCAYLPSSGPSVKEVSQVSTLSDADRTLIQIVDVNEALTRQLLAQRTQKLFSETFGNRTAETSLLGTGDVVEINIWEAVPATLFGSGLVDLKGVPGTSRVTTLPEQMIGSAGTIGIPFAGSVQARGRTLQQIEQAVAERLNGKANQPQVLARLIRNVSSNVTVVGEVAASAMVPLSPRGERLLDALAAVGGSRQPVNKTTIQVTRGPSVQALPLDTIIRDPLQNIPLLPGDVITALFQPLSFTALGATGKNEEVNFEAQGITLAQALARVGGLLDARSNPQGVFIFRLEQPGALDWPRQPVATTPDGLVPVVYRVDLKDPGSFFMMQSFAMSDKDVLFVSNAPVTELQKFLNTVFSAVYPLITVINAVN